MSVDTTIRNARISSLKVRPTRVRGFAARRSLLCVGPLQSTVKDFWRMVWQEGIVIIVMTTNIHETGMTKCFPYWPTETRTAINVGPYQIQNEGAENFGSFVVTTLLLKKKDQRETRTIYHAHYLKWPDHGIPTTTVDALAFLEKVEQYRLMTKTQAPILLHCSAGIGRTGTFCAIDIGIKRYLEKQIVDIASTVHKMRTERAGSVQTEGQYLFAYLAMMDYVRQQQALQERVNEPIKVPDLQLGNVNSFHFRPISVLHMLSLSIDSSLDTSARRRGRRWRAENIARQVQRQEIDRLRAIRELPGRRVRLEKLPARAHLAAREDVERLVRQRRAAGHALASHVPDCAQSATLGHGSLFLALSDTRQYK